MSFDLGQFVVMFDGRACGGRRPLRRGSLVPVSKQVVYSLLFVNKLAVICVLIEGLVSVRQVDVIAFLVRERLPIFIGRGWVRHRIQLRLAPLRKVIK